VCLCLAFPWSLGICCGSWPTPPGFCGALVGPITNLAAVPLRAGALEGIATSRAAVCLAMLGVVAAPLESTTAAAVEIIGIKYLIVLFLVVTMVPERRPTLVSTSRDVRNPGVARASAGRPSSADFGSSLRLTEEPKPGFVTLAGLVLANLDHVTSANKCLGANGALRSARWTWRGSARCSPEPPQPRRRTSQIPIAS
jgi:hypothetical protein